MALLDVARSYYAGQRSLVRRIVDAVAAIWGDLDHADLSGSWTSARAGERLFVTVSQAQLLGAQLADRYVAAAVAAQAADTDLLGEFLPGTVAGVASDGRDLEDLLFQPIIRAKTAIGRGETPERALDIGRGALTRIAGTQVADAARAATAVAMVARPAVTGWVRMLTPPSCGRCAVLAGRRYRWSDGFERHPLCLVPGTVVSGPATRAATRRWYQGELAVIRTASGKKLTITGNHPVLTDRGWLPARLIGQGDYVVGRAAGDRAVGLLVPDEDQMPAPIEDVWRAHRVGSLRRMPVAAEDFHGDGVDGHVDVVAADGLLWPGIRPASVQEPGELLLAFRAEAAVALAYASLRAAPLFAHTLPATGVVRCRGLCPSLGGRSASGPHEPGFAAIADLDASAAQTFADRTTADAEAVRDGVLALASPIGVDDGFDVEWERLTARWDAPAVPFSMQSRLAYAEIGKDLRLRLTGQVAADRVVENARVEWSGHVYNLTSAEGWYDADGIIVSNCDCIHVPAVEDTADDLTTDPAAYFRSLTPEDQNRYFTKAGAEAIRRGADIGQVVNARRGARGLSQPGRLTAAEQKMLRGGRERGHLDRVDVYGRQLAVTTEGVTVRGLAGQRLARSGGTRRVPGVRNRVAKTPRLMPEAVLQLAGDDRDEAARLLKRFGYLI